MKKNKKKNQSETDSLRKLAENKLNQLSGKTDLQFSEAESLKLFHELQVHQIELEMQNEELLAAHSNLETFQKKYTEIFDFAPNSYFTLNDRGVIQEVNLTGARLLGIDSKPLIGDTFARFIYHEELEVFNTYWNNLIHTKEHQVCELRISGHDEMILYARLDLSLIDSGAISQVLIIITDITLQKKIEETQSFLLECSWAKAGRDFFEVLAEYLATTLTMDYVCIDKLHDKALKAETLAIFFDGHFEENVEYALHDTPCGQVVGQNVCCFPNKVRHQFPNDVVLQEMVAESYVGITLLGSDGKPIGLIAVIGRKPLQYSKQAEIVLKQVSIRAASELEHRNIEKKLREREYFFSESQRAANIGSFKADFNSDSWESSEVLDRILGIESNYVRTTNAWLDIVHPADLDMAHHHLNEEIIHQHLAFNKEFRIIRKSDGETRWVNGLGKAEFDNHNNIISLYGTIQDITNRKKTEELINTTNERLSLAQEVSGSGTWDCDIETNSFYWSKEYLKLFGLGSDTTPGFEVWLNALHPDDREISTKHIHDAIEQGIELVNEYRIVLPGGEIRCIRATGKTIYSNDKPVRMLGLCTDITRQKKAEEALKGNEEKFRAIFEDNSSGMLIVEEDTTLVMVNEAFCQLVGCSKEEVIGTSWTRLLPPAELERIKEYNRLRLINSKDAPDKYEFKYYRNNSELRDGLMSVSLIPSLKKMVGSFLDITERKKMEEALVESEERFSKAFYLSPLGINIFNQKTGRCVNANKAFLDLIGYSRDEIIGHTSKDVNIGVTYEEQTSWLNELLEKDSIQNKEIRVRQKSGQYVDASFSLAKIEINGEELVLLQTIDITERKKAESINNRYNIITKYARDPMLLIDPEGNIIEGNNAAIEFYGYSYDELLKFKIYDLREVEDRSLVDIQIKKALSEGILFETNHKNKNGTLLPVEISSVGVQIDGKELLLSVIRDISERKKAEELLLESESRFRLALKNAPITVAAQDKDLRYIWAYNQRTRKPEEIIGKTDNDLYPEQADLLREIKLGVLKSGKEVSKQLWISSEGHKLFLDLYIEPLRNIDGDITGIGMATVDLTPMKLSEGALLESAATLRGILNATTESIWLFGTDGKVLLGNQTAIDRIGLPAERIIGHRFDELPENLAKSNSKLMKKVALLKQPVVMTDERAGIHFEHTFYPVYSSDGSINRIAAFSRDITQRVREVQTQIKLNRAFAALAKSSQAMAQFTDEKLYLQEVCNIIANDCGFAMVWIGYASDDEKKSIIPIANAGFEDGYLDTLQLTWNDNIRGHGPTGTAIRTGNRGMCTNMLTDPSFLPWRKEAKKRGYASSIVFPLKTENKTFGAISIYAKDPDSFTKDEISLLAEMTNNLAHGIKSIRLQKDRELAEEALSRAYERLGDQIEERTRELEITNTLLRNEISNRVKQEQSLSRAEEKYRTVANYTNDWESWLGPDGKYVYVSPSCFEITGYTAEEFLNDADLYLRITHPEDSEIIKTHSGTKLKKRITSCSFDYRIINRDGEVRWIGHKCQPVYNPDGIWIGQRGSNRDITDRKLSESILVESQKQLRALTQQINAIAEDERMRIAREIHDELGHMLTALKYDLESLTTLTDTTVEGLKSEIGSLINMVEALIDTVRKISTELRPAILDHLGLLPAIEWLIRQFRAHTKICCHFQYTELDVEFDKNETTNIFRIMQEILTNVARHSQATHVNISLSLKDNFFEINVSDNGIGFNSANFYHSVSLGLMGIKERAMSIGATVDVKSEPNKGTAVTLLLPRKKNRIKQ